MSAHDREVLVNLTTGPTVTLEIDVETITCNNFYAAVEAKGFGFIEARGFRLEALVLTGEGFGPVRVPRDDTLLRNLIPDGSRMGVIHGIMRDADDDAGAYPTNRKSTVEETVMVHFAGPATPPRQGPIKVPVSDTSNDGKLVNVALSKIRVDRNSVIATVVRHVADMDKNQVVVVLFHASQNVATGAQMVSCDICGKASSIMFTCCGSATYCGAACQRLDWTSHKVLCNK